MPARRLPVVPDLDQLRHQARDLHRAMRRGDPDALAELREHHPNPPAPDDVKLAHAQLVLARSYGASSWPRLVQSCQLIEAIWADDVDTVRRLVVKHPSLLHEDAGIRNDNWGPPLSYAANVGRDRIISVLHELGATDLDHAIGRAVIQGRIDTARLIHRLRGSPKPPPGALGGPAYTLSVEGTEFLFAIGAEMVDEHGSPDAPVDVVLETDSRKPEAKHRILELYVEHGFELPDTPMMAVHRGRIDLLEKLLRTDRGLLTRTFTYAEIFPPALKCRQPDGDGYDEGFPRTPIRGSTLLHVCIEFDELEMARWLLDQGMSPDVRADVDANGFGGHTPLFGAVVSYPHFWMNFTGGWAHSRKPQNAAFAELLLDRGADPNARASFRMPTRSTDGRPLRRDYRDVTPLGWGEAFEIPLVVSQPAMRLIEARGGHR